MTCIVKMARAAPKGRDMPAQGNALGSLVKKHIPNSTFDIRLGGIEVLSEFDQLFDDLHRQDGAGSPKGA